jgi:hypothetical protein
MACLKEPLSWQGTRCPGCWTASISFLPVFMIHNAGQGDIACSGLIDDFRIYNWVVDP